MRYLTEGRSRPGLKARWQDFAAWCPVVVAAVLFWLLVFAVVELVKVAL
jgi:hypothetical protein